MLQVVKLDAAGSETEHVGRSEPRQIRLGLPGGRATGVCPVPGDCEEVPFILLLSIKGRINNLVSEVQKTSVIPINLSVAELQRDVGCAAHRVFDVAIKLQRAQLETRYARWRQGALPNLPCMKSLMKLQRSYTAPMSGWSEPLSPD